MDQGSHHQNSEKVRMPANAIANDHIMTDDPPSFPMTSDRGIPHIALDMQTCTTQLHCSLLLASITRESEQSKGTTTSLLDDNYKSI
jgi:hypothetical protein